MPKFSDYRAMAKARGSLALVLYAVINSPAVAPPEMSKHPPNHLAYQTEPERGRPLVFAGPLSDLSGENIEGVGMIVYRAANLEAARAIANADPMYARAIKTYEIRGWLVNEGSLTLNVGLSVGTVALDQTAYLATVSTMRPAARLRSRYPRISRPSGPAHPGTGLSTHARSVRVASSRDRNEVSRPSAIPGYR